MINGTMTVGAAAGLVDFGMRFIASSSDSVGGAIYGAPGSCSVFSYSFNGATGAG